MKPLQWSTEGFGKTMPPSGTDIWETLQPGETLLWKGQPVEGVRVHFSMQLVIFPLIGVVMLSVSIAMFAAMWGSGLPTAFTLLMILPFFLVGAIFLAFTAALPSLEARRRARFRYAVTNQRLLIQGPRHFSAYQIRECRGLQVKLYKDGCGTIYTERKTIRGWSMRYLFEEIPDAESVYRLIEQQTANPYII